MNMFNIPTYLTMFIGMDHNTMTLKLVCQKSLKKFQILNPLLKSNQIEETTWAQLGTWKSFGFDWDFQKSTYLDNLKLRNFSLSTNLNASLPQIGRYKIGLGTIVGNFGEPFQLAFHNLIKGPSIGLHTWSLGETLYCITGQFEESTYAYQYALLMF